MMHTAVLQSLATMDSAQAEAVLCRAIDYFLPSPTETVALDPLAQRVVDEARAAATEERGAERILGDLLAEYVLPPADEEEAKARIGARGELRWDLYELSFAFGKAQVKNSVTVAEARSALRNPQIVEHIYADHGDLPEPKRQSATLAASLVQDDDAGEHWIVFPMMRDGAGLRVMGAWRIFPDLLVGLKQLTLRGLMERFAERFAVRHALVVGAAPRKLYWREVLKGRALVHFPLAVDGIVLAANNGAKPDEWHVAIGIGVPWLPYAAYLKGHRIIQ